MFGARDDVLPRCQAQKSLSLSEAVGSQEKQMKRSAVIITSLVRAIKSRTQAQSFARAKAGWGKNTSRSTLRLPWQHSIGQFELRADLRCALCKRQQCVTKLPFISIDQSVDFCTPRQFQRDAKIGIWSLSQSLDIAPPFFSATIKCRKGGFDAPRHSRRNASAPLLMTQLIFTQMPQCRHIHSAYSPSECCTTRCFWVRNG